MAREQKRSQAQQRMHKEVLKKDTTYETRFMHDYMYTYLDTLRFYDVTVPAW